MYINFYQQLINGPLDAESSYKLADFLLSDATDIEIASLLTLLNTHHIPLTYYLALAKL